MFDYGMYQFNENELMEMFKQNNIDCNNIIVLVFCDYCFSHMSFYPLYEIYDDVDVYIIEKNEHNLNNLKMLSDYNNIDYDEISSETMKQFINENYDNVLCKIYFGHS